MTEFLEGCTPVNVIPDYVQNFAEASMYVMESVDNDFFEVLEAAGFVNENGAIVDEAVEVVTEEEDAAKGGLAKLADMFIETFKKLWAKIQGFFEKVVKWFDDQKAKLKDHLKSLIDKASAATIGKIDAKMLDKVKADKKVGSYTSFNIDKEALGAIKATYAEVSKAVANNVALAEAIDAEEKIKDAKEKLLASLGGQTTSEIAAAVKAKLTGSTNKAATIADIKADFNDIKAAVFGNDDKKVLSAAYTSAKKAIDQTIKSINAKKHKGLRKTEPEKTYNRDLALYVSFAKSANQALHAYHNAVVGVMRIRFIQYAHIISVCVSAAVAASAKEKAAAAKAKIAEKLPKKKEKEAATESVSLASLFEW